jgi:CRISPR type I-E-associated protein CasB/Cse2
MRRTNESTREYVRKLNSLKQGELGLLRKLANCPLDRELQGFNLFSGLWWPLRQKDQKAPRREVAWLVAKLYASRPLPQAEGSHLAVLLGRKRPPFKKGDSARARFTCRFDAMLGASLESIEPFLREAIGMACEYSENPSIDWERLTDDLSAWEKESIRNRWAEEFVNPKTKPTQSRDNENSEE